MAKRTRGFQRNPLAERISRVINVGPTLEIAAQGRGSEDLTELSPRDIETLVGELRAGETGMRRLRKRLEALQRGDDRICGRPDCQRPIAGRPDARYCSPNCRLVAHRVSTSRRNA